MKVLLVGTDVAQCFAFKILEEALKVIGIEVKTVLGNGKPVTWPSMDLSELKNLVRETDIVLTGLSSSSENAGIEIHAAEVARDLGKPFGFYADTYGSQERPWFAHLRADTKFLFVLNVEEAESSKLLFPNAIIVASGNPTWENFFFPALTRETVRKQLNVSDDEQLVFIPGGTPLEINLSVLTAVITTLNSYPNLQKKRWKIAYGVHPGDNNYKNNPCVYDSFREWSRFPFEIIPREKMRGSDMLPGVDFVIDCGTTIGIEAAHQRKKIICYLCNIGINNLKITINSAIWPPCEKGVMHLVERGTDELATAFSMDFTKIHERQAEVFPSPAAKGASVNAIIETLKSIVANQ